MGVIASFEYNDLYVVPGEEITCRVRLRNVGSVVDQFTLDVLGDAKDWTTVSPDTVNVFPHQEATVELTFKPPRSADLPKGDVSFAVRVMSHEDTEGSTVEEGVVEIGGYTEPSIELVRRTVRGRRAARFRVVVTNRGNEAFETEVFAADPDDKLGFRFAQRQLTVVGGTSTIVRLRARPRKLLLKGAPETLPFQVMAQYGEGELLSADAVMAQYPLVPKGLPRLLAMGIAAIAALVILWELVLKPVVKSEAGEAAEEKATQLASSAQQAESSAKEAQAKAEKAQEDAKEAAGNAVGAGGQANGQFPALAGDASGGGSGDGESDQGGTASGGPLQAVDFRIQAKAPASDRFKTFSVTTPQKQTYYLSDIYLQNPFGDSGVLQLRRDDAVLFEVNLMNFRDHDYHFVQPIEFEAGQEIVLAVQCAKPGAALESSAATACSPAGYFSGRAVVDGS
jgi:hypothetical protein